jgi:hypothetical protein
LDARRARPGQRRQRARAAAINNSGNRVNNGNINTGDINVDNDWGGDWNGWGDYPLAPGSRSEQRRHGRRGGLWLGVLRSSVGCSPYPYRTYTYYNRAAGLIISRNMRATRWSMCRCPTQIR